MLCTYMSFIQNTPFLFKPDLYVLMPSSLLCWQLTTKLKAIVPFLSYCSMKHNNDGKRSLWQPSTSWTATRGGWFCDLFLLWSLICLLKSWWPACTDNLRCMLQVDKGLHLSCGSKLCEDNLSASKCIGLYWSMHRPVQIESEGARISPSMMVTLLFLLQCSSVCALGPAVMGTEKMQIKR